MEQNFLVDQFFKGGPIMWPLCLLIVLAILIERLWRLLLVPGEEEPEQPLNEAEDVLGSQGGGAVELFRQSSGVLLVLTVLAGPTAVVAAPPEIAGPASVSVSFAERDTVQVSAFTATDPDGDGIAWVLAGDDAGAFTLGASSGVLQFDPVPNYEVPSDADDNNVYEVWVIAQDDGTPSKADSVAVAVTVTDGDDPGTVVLSSASPQVGMALTATLTDEDGQVSKVRWTWQRRVDASADWAAIPSSSAASYTPVREDVGYQLRAKVKYSDRWGGDKKVTKKAPQKVMDVPGSPALSAEPGDGQVELRWTDPASDGGRPIIGYEYWYSDAGGNAWSSVDGGASADNLTVRGLTNGQEYTFAVRAVNELGASLADSTQATPQAANQPPEVTGPASVSVAFAENDTSAVGTFTATDPEGDAIEWLLAGDDAGAFTLGASIGVLKFALAPNYEAPTDSDADNVYQVWVIAQDDGTPSRADSVSVSVTVTDADDPGMLTLTLSSSSPQVGVALTATLTDEDGQVSKVRWTWQRRFDASAAWADIPSSGAASYTPVVEDVGYQLRAKVKYSDRWGGDKKVTKKVPQKVVDVPGAPALSAEPGDGQVGLRWTAPTSYGGRPITGYEYWYSQEGGFAWTPVGGGASADKLTVSSLTNGQEYTFAVRAVNALGAGLADSTQATPQASNRPPLIGGPATVSVSFAENDTVQVDTFTATDPEGDGITWLLAGDDAGAFTLGASSGMLQFDPVPNYEAPTDSDADNVYQVWVIAQDDGTPSQADSVSVAVTVTDGDDLGTLTLTLSSSSPQVGVALTATLTDEDGQVSKIRWTWQRRVDSSADWADIPSSGAASYTPVRADVGYQLRARVKYDDRWGGDKKVTKKAPQQVVDVPGPPALSAEPGDGQVGLRWTVPASDGGRPITGYEYWYSDAGDNAWTPVDGGASADHLTVSSLTNRQEYTFAVRAVNELGAGLADSTQATPQASNRPPLIGGPATVSVSFAENDTSAVSTFTATDPEGDGIAWVLAGDDAGAFRVGASSGVLQFDPAPNYEVPSDTDADNVYQVWVIAQDDGTPAMADSVSVVVTITDADDPGMLTLSSASPQMGVPLTATLHDEDRLLSVVFDWLAVKAKGGAGKLGAGKLGTNSVGTDTTYVFTPEAYLVGFRLLVKAEYTDQHGTHFKYTPWTEPVFSTVAEAVGTVNLTTTSPQVRVALTATLTDPDGDIYRTNWTWQRRSGSTAAWANIPSSDSTYTPVDGDVGYQLRATVSYQDGYSANQDSAHSAATEPVQANVPDVIAYYPFNGDARDASGNEYHGTLSGPVSTRDRFGNEAGAILFNGTNHRINLPRAVLNGQTNVSVSFWLKTSKTGTQSIISGANQNNDNEYLIYFLSRSQVTFYSHGSGAIGRHEDPKERCDVTIQSIADGNWHHFAVVRNASLGHADFFIDGTSYANRCRSLVYNTLVVDSGGLIIGQEQDSVGGGFDSSQVFRGALDDLRIYGKALSAAEVQELSSGPNPKQVATREEPATSGLTLNFPNPFNASTQITYRLATSGPVRLEICNVLGQPVKTLVEEFQTVGSYQIHWDARDQRGAAVATGVYFTRLLYPGGVQVRRLLYLK